MTVFLLFSLACTPTTPVEPSGVPSEPTAGPDAPCEAPTDEFLDSNAVAGATMSCDSQGCEVLLVEDQPLFGAELHATGDTLILFGPGSDTLLVGRGSSVTQVTVSTSPAPSVGTDGRIWAFTEDTVVGFEEDGRIVQRCTAPPVDVVSGVLHVAGRLLVSGLTEASDGNLQPVLYEATPSGWEVTDTEVNGPLRAHPDQGVFILGYGYAELVDPSGESQLLGGTDDDFSGLTICEDGSYWMGGLTGILMRCDAQHVCEHVDLDTFRTPFVHPARGCDSDGGLWWMNGLTQLRWTRSLDGIEVSEPIPDGLLHQWADAGRTWSIVDVSTSL